MSSSVLRRSFLPAAALFLLVNTPALVVGQKSCECGDPSLGTVTCENDQEPFCMVRAGKVHGRCRSKGQRSGTELQRWVFSQALGREVTDSELRDPAVQQSMAEGHLMLRNADGKLTLINFRPTKDLQRTPSKIELKAPEFQREPEKGIIVDSMIGPSATSATAATSASTSISTVGDSACEVCVMRAGVRECKKSDVRTENQLNIIRAELCKSDQPCLDKKPSVKCLPQ